MDRPTTTLLELLRAANKLHIASKYGHGHVVGLPDLGGLGSPAPVHLVLAQQLDLLDQDVVYGEPSDEHTGPLGLVLERDEACRHLAGLAGWVGWLAR